MCVNQGEQSMKYITRDEKETLRVAAEFSGTLVPGSVVALIGELGAGKTVFARGVAHSLGIRENITSPTFTLIHEYRGSVPLYHMDLYRMNGIREICNIGVEDYFYGDGICLVEWAEKLGELLPENAISVHLNHLGDTLREILIERPVT